ncbi:hypothetical protein [Clostridium tertium]|uniref:Uncharacterized protein n=1 Tax=Clostridium tertium TaxID=1559 RepID=A0A6N3ACS2_9CLOT
MGSERRNLEQLRVFFAFSLAWGIISNIAIIFIKLGIHNEFLWSIDFNGFSFMMMFSTFILGIFSIQNIHLNCKEEVLFEVKRKTLVLKLIMILFAVYGIASVILLKDIILLRFQILIMINLFLVYINERKIQEARLTDYRLRWRRDYDNPGTLEEESNIFWRMKIRFFPHAKVRIEDRFERIKLVNLVFVVIFLSMGDDIIKYLFIILLVPEIIYIFEAIFGLYTTSEGICTGIVETTHGKNSRRPLFKVYVTNYEKKEEITFKVLDYCYISEMENVVIIHSSITKRVIKVQGRIENFI